MGRRTTPEGQSVVGSDPYGTRGRAGLFDATGAAKSSFSGKAEANKGPHLAAAYLQRPQIEGIILECSADSR